MALANIFDRRSMERIYLREIWAVESGSNSRGSQQILHGLLIESSPDNAGNFRIRRATQQTAEKEPQRYAIFICPYMGKAYDAFTPAPGLHGAIEEKHDALDSLDDEYADFIARVLETATHARLSHIPGHGEKLPLG
jgi:hypothetical protein